MMYLLQMTIYAALMYGIYLLTLKNNVSYSLNRVYLLACALLPAVLPLIKLPYPGRPLLFVSKTMDVLLPQITVLSGNTPAKPGVTGWDNVILYTYLLITAILMVRIIVQYYTIRQFVRGCSCEQVQGAKVLRNTGAGPGSFRNYIFLPDADIAPAIFEHELAHIRLRHSTDIMIISILHVIFWPNVVLHLIAKELKTVHEFQADSYAAGDKTSYINTLLNNTFNTQQFSLSHTFFYHPLKRRIMMLKKNPQSRSKLRLTIAKTGLITTTLLAAIVYLQSCDKKKDSAHATSATVAKAGNQPRRDTVRDTINVSRPMDMHLQNGKHSYNIGPGGIKNTVAANEIYKSADTMPKAGYELSAFLTNNLRYPESARKKGIEGKVVVKFVVDNNGKICFPEIARSPDTTLSAEALRVVSLMPKWKAGIKNGKPASVYFFLPILFKLS